MRPLMMRRFVVSWGEGGRSSTGLRRAEGGASMMWRGNVQPDLVGWTVEGRNEVANVSILGGRVRINGVGWGMEKGQIERKGDIATMNALTSSAKLHVPVVSRVLNVGAPGEPAPMGSCWEGDQEEAAAQGGRELERQTSHCSPPA